MKQLSDRSYSVANMEGNLVRRNRKDIRPLHVDTRTQIEINQHTDAPKETEVCHQGGTDTSKTVHNTGATKETGPCHQGGVSQNSKHTGETKESRPDHQGGSDYDKQTVATKEIGVSHQGGPSISRKGTGATKVVRPDYQGGSGPRATKEIGVDYQGGSSNTSIKKSLDTQTSDLVQSQSSPTITRSGRTIKRPARYQE